MFKFVKRLFVSSDREGNKENHQENINEDSISESGSAQVTEVASRGLPENVEIKLSLPNEGADPIANWVLKELEEDLASLPPILAGEVAINGIYTFRNSSEEKLKTRCFIRNGALKPVRLEEVALAIVNSQDEVLARQIFDLSGLGEIPAGGARPFDIYFDASAVMAPIPKDDWRLVFGILTDQEAVVADEEPRALPGVEAATINEELAVLGEELLAANGLPIEGNGQPLESISQSPSEAMRFMDLAGFDEKQRQDLERFLDGLPPVAPGEVNFFPLQAQLLDDGRLAATVLIRNGSIRDIVFDKLQLAILDSEKKALAAGLFEPAGLNVEPNKARFWTFNFPAEVVQAEPDDLAQWSLAIIK